MRGYLIVNHFVDVAHFHAVYRLFLHAAAKMNITLTMKTTGELLGDMDDVPVEKPDFALFWDKDTHLAERLQRKGWKLFNSAETIRLCDNKADTAEALARQGVPMPQTVVAPLTFPFAGYKNTDFVNHACQILGFPVVIKELYGSLGEQVYLAKSLEEAVKIVSSLGARPFLFQRFVSSSFGRDIRVNVVGDTIPAAMLRQGSEGEFRSNIGAGGRGSPVSLTEEEQCVALAAARAVGADFAGVDLLYGEGGHPLVCEVNSNPQFTGTLRFCGVDLAEHILRYIQTKIKK